MNLIVPLVLLLLWLVFSAQGSQFLAFLFLAGGLISLAAGLLGNKKPSGSKVTSTKDAIIVENDAPQIPSTIKVKVKPNWSGIPQFEKDTIKMADAFNVVGKTVMRVIRGKKKK